MTIKKQTQIAINKYSRAICLEAFARHHGRGDGARTIGFQLGLTTRQADAAIEAGRDIVNNDIADIDD